MNSKGFLYMYYFGIVKNKVYLLRAEKRWSQTELAKELGVTRQTIAAIENNKFIPSLELAFSIAYIFQKDLNDVFNFEPYEEDEGVTKMSSLIAVIIMLGMLINLIFLIREGKDERWNIITNRPLNYAFSLLFIGYTSITLIDTRYKFSVSTFKMVYDYLFVGALVVYIVLLIIERRRLS